MDKAWKAWERRVAKMFNGKRRGADFRGEGRKGKNDIIAPGWSIECKLQKAFPNYLLDWCRQAEGAKENELDIPVVIFKKKGSHVPDNDALVIMRLEEFREHFVE